MNNNSAILNCFLKQLYLKFEDKFFVIDLTEGDLEDSWNSIQFSDKTTLDFNFEWAEGENNPTACLYGLTYLPESDTYETNTKEAYPLRIAYIFGNKADYFDMEYQAEIGINIFRVYSGCKMVKRTSSLDIASDFSAKATIVGKVHDSHIVGMDKYGATKVMEIADKHNKFYQIQEKGKEINDFFGMTPKEVRENRMKYNLE